MEEPVGSLDSRPARNPGVMCALDRLAELKGGDVYGLLDA
jgi:hypothetical protein